MKDTFFDQQIVDNHLAQLFFGYIHYCHESVWLLKQRVFGKLCISLNYLGDDQLQEAIVTQKRAFASGRQIHIGEILLQTYLLDIEQVYSLCQILGEEIVCCEDSGQCYKTFFSTEEERSRHGQNLRLKEPQEVTQEQLLRFLRIDYWWPRSIPKNTKESHDLFVFLNMETHSKMKVSELDREFHNVLETFEHWTTTPILADEKYLQNLNKEDIVREQAKSLELIKQVFLGYRKNLRELVWLLQQKMFEDLAVKYYKITPEQVENALKVQHRAFHKNKQLQLSEVMLHMYLLDENQVYDILKGLGNRIMYDEKANYYLTSSQSISAETVNGSSLEEIRGKYEVLMQSMRIDIAKPILIPQKLVPHSSFLFFRKRENYVPDFSLSSQELRTAICSFYTFLKLKSPKHLQKEITKTEFSKTASQVLSNKKSSHATLSAVPHTTLSAVPLSEESMLEMESLGNKNTTLQKKLRQTMSLSAIPVSEDDKQEIFGTKKTTEILKKFSKTITMSLQKRARAKKQQEKPISPQVQEPQQSQQLQKPQKSQEAVPATRKPIKYEQYSETVYGYVMANIDAQEKGLPTQKEIMGKRTNMFDQIAKRIDRPQEVAKVKKDELNIYDEILAEIETDQSEGNQNFAQKRAQVHTEEEEDLSNSYYIDFKSGEQMPEYLDEIGEESKAIVSEEDVMDISTEVDSFLQSFDSIDENTDIEKLYDKYGVDVGKDYDPLLDIKSDNVTGNSSKKENPQLKRTISISQPKLHSAIPTALEYIDGYTPPTKKSSKPILIMLAIIFTSSLVYLFIQPYLNQIDEVEPIANNKKENNKPKKVKNIDDDFSDEDFKEIVIEETSKDPKISNTKKNTRPKTTIKRPVSPNKNNGKKNNLRQALYGKEQNPKKVAKFLRNFSQAGQLGEGDVSYIKELHNQYSTNKKVRGLCIWAMGTIKSIEGRQWLEDLLVSSQQSADKKSALNALEKIGDSAAKDTILETFQREQDSALIEAAAYSLTKVSPENEQVQQAMIAKFYEITDENMKRRLLNAMSSMQIKSQSALFVRIAVDAQYSTSIRLEALDALMLNSAGNGSQYVSEISVLTASQDEELKDKVEETLEFLSNR